MTTQLLINWIIVLFIYIFTIIVKTAKDKFDLDSGFIFMTSTLVFLVIGLTTILCAYVLCWFQNLF